MKGLFGGGLAIDRKSDTRFGDTLHLIFLNKKGIDNVYWR